MEGKGKVGRVIIIQGISYSSAARSKSRKERKKKKKKKGKRTVKEKKGKKNNFHQTNKDFSLSLISIINVRKSHVCNLSNPRFIC